MWEEIKSRAFNPLMSSFIVSWLLWNHKLVMLLVSNESLHQKWADIDNKLYPQIFNVDLHVALDLSMWAESFNGWHLLNNSWMLLVAPLLSVAFYHYIYPKFDLTILRKHLDNAKKRTDIKDQIELHTELEILKRKVEELTKKSDEDEQTIKDVSESYNSLQTKYQELTKEVNEEHVKLTNIKFELEKAINQNADLELNFDRLSKENANLKSMVNTESENENELSNDELEILTFISNNSPVSDDLILGGSRVAHKRAAIEALVRREFIWGQNGYYKTTKEGDSYLIENT